MKVIYQGLTGHNQHTYQEVEEDRTLGRTLHFKKKLYKKGGIGSLYTINQNDDGSFRYFADQDPEYLEEDGAFHPPYTFFKDKIQAWRLTDSLQASLQKRETVKKFDEELGEMKAYLRTLNRAQRSAFLGHVIESLSGY